ncbi:MAG: hypothetical protein GXP55_16265 [Deltaproteobacteria bacterium]|nr:hypothetical protein [Deltaproteobacteria bacterium]
MRDGLRVPLMPLAEWLASNWWYLTSESPPSYPVRPARDAMASTRSWYRRHDLLFAREGFSLPDLLIARADDERVLVQVASDPGRSTRFPVRFVENQSVLVPKVVVESELRRLLEAVLARLEGSETADAHELRERWSEITALNGDDLVLRQRAGALGLDGDCPDEVPDDLAHVLVETFGMQPSSLVADLLELPAAVAADTHTVSWVGEARESIQRGTSAQAPLPASLRGRAPDARKLGENTPAHEVGWELASGLRRDLLGLAATAHGEQLDAALGPIIQVVPDAPAATRGLRGLLRADEALAVVLPPSAAPTRRFLGARALCLGVLGGPERLITDAPSWSQSVCRAFATELIAPRAYLEKHVEGAVVSEERAEELALELNAPRRAVEHQIANHDIARLD